jgi:anion-transporting  ArsA/GET3 family ATPase
MLAKDLLVVTGKGGVGKSTVAAAVGVVAARRGLRTIVAEVAARDDVTRALDPANSGRYAENELAPGLHHISIDPQAALEEYLRDSSRRRSPTRSPTRGCSRSSRRRRPACASC